MTAHPRPLRAAIVGTARRSEALYGPILHALPDVELVAVWGRSEASARRLGERLGVPHFTDLGQLVRETAAELAVVSVAYAANGSVGLMAVEAGLHVLLETPIAHRLDEADAIIRAAAERGLKVEVAEQFHRRPLEAAKLALIASGLFGRVHTSFNDFAGHGYHGVSVMRSYLGFEARPLTVSGLVRDFPLAAHRSRLAGSDGPRTETQEHGLIEFDGGRVGAYHWTSVGYDSAVRWWRSSRFLAERGMGISTMGPNLEVEERLTLLAPGGEAPGPVTLERRFERTDGGALAAIVAHTGHPAWPEVRWDNPFRALGGRGVQWHDDEIGVAGCVVSLLEAVRAGAAPSYGAAQARLDQEVALAIRLSSLEGRPVTLPLDPAAQTI